MAVAGGVTTPVGFRAAGVTAGIKASGRPDVALVTADGPAAAAGVFTRSRAAAPSVRLCRHSLESGDGRARAVVVTSGNANAATGRRGAEDAAATAALTARLVGCAPDEVLVCATGVIGVPLPMERVARGVESAAAALSPDGGAAAAEAIRTTDAWPKEAGARLEADGAEVRIGGMAKGAGMIRPDLGTMIAVLTTDAGLPPARLDAHLRAAVDATFNAVTVDGSTSTSDTVLLLAGGAAVPMLDERHDDAFAAALADVCRALALAIVRDGEGAGRIGRYEVVGARDAEEARRVARAVAEDQLVRCALHGGDPNWGRIYAALGACGVDLDPDRVAVDLDGVALLRDGAAAPGLDAGAAARAMRAAEVPFHIDLARGDGRAVVWASDLSPAYVRANSEYTT